MYYLVGDAATQMKALEKTGFGNYFESRNEVLNIRQPYILREANCIEKGIFSASYH